LIFELLSFNGYNVQNFAILAEKIFGFSFGFFWQFLVFFIFLSQRDLK